MTASAPTLAPPPATPPTSAPPNTPAPTTTSAPPTTSATASRSAEGADLVTAVRRLHDQMEALDSLDPGPRVDALFTELVGLVTRPPRPGDDAVLADPGLRALAPRLHALCARAETAMENHWADRVTTSPDPATTLARFPYHANYRQLVRLEWHAVAGVTHRRPRRVALVGSGPLPLTSLLLAGRRGVRVDNVDVDAGAIGRSRAVAAAVGASGLGFRRVDVLDHDDLAAYDVVVLAALVGLDPGTKQLVLDHLAARMAPGAVLVARSAHGLRALLYPAVDVAALRGFEPLSVVHPLGPVINSVVVARRPVQEV